MQLSEQISIARRFCRSVRLESDCAAADVLEGFVPVRSALETLQALAGIALEGRDTAFTLTGPYGCGKSTLALALAALCSPDAQERTAASGLLDATPDSRLGRLFLQDDEPWHCLVMSGGREPLSSRLGAVLAAHFPDLPSADDPLTMLTAASRSERLLVIADEFGRFIEQAVAAGDLHFMQELAECVSRTAGRVIFIGILHQSFAAYAWTLRPELQQEWAKVQGRYQDLMLSPSPQESLMLIAQSIVQQGYDVTPHADLTQHCAAACIPDADTGHVPARVRLTELYRACLPLHPLCAMLLAALSRKSFGQNERSIYSFLSTLEPLSFSCFLQEASTAERLYMPHDLYDYLQANHELNISRSRDAHRWTIAAAVLDRLSGEEGILQQLIKAAAVIDIFGGLYRLIPTAELLALAVNLEPEAAKAQLQRLVDLRALLHREFDHSYRLFIGSDFDFDRELEAQLSRTVFDPGVLRSCLGGGDYVVARRHYARSGTLRYLGVSYVSSGDLQDFQEHFRASSEHIGEVVVLIGDDTGEDTLPGLRQDVQQHLLCCTPADSAGLRERGRRLQAIAALRDSELLQGDAAAREEVALRLEDAELQLRQALQEAMSRACWVYGGRQLDGGGMQGGLSSLSDCASLMAERLYPACPDIHNELINRNKVSANVKGATRVLLNAMIAHAGEERLGFEGFPPEFCIYASLLLQPQLHAPQAQTGHYAFGYRSAACQGEWRELFEATERYLRAKPQVSLTQLYEFWGAPPFGLKLGVMPVLALVLILANPGQLAVYDEQGLVLDPDAAFTDTLLNFPQRITCKWHSDSPEHQRLLQHAVQALQEAGQEIASAATALEAARSLVRFMVRLPHLTRETQLLSAPAAQLRGAVLKADDPVALLFERLPQLCAGLEHEAAPLRGLLCELRDFLPSQLKRVRDVLCEVLNTPSNAELRPRAAFVAQTQAQPRTLRFARIFTEHADDDFSDDLLQRVVTFCSEQTYTRWTDHAIAATLRELPVLALNFRQSECHALVRNASAGRRVLCVTFPTAAAEDLTVVAEVRADQEADIRQRAARLYEQLCGKDGTADRNEAYAVLAELGQELRRRFDP